MIINMCETNLRYDTLNGAIGIEGKYLSNIEFSIEPSSVLFSCSSFVQFIK